MKGMIARRILRTPGEATPEECVTLLRFDPLGLAVAIVAVAIIAVMSGLVWRVLIT